LFIFIELLFVLKGVEVFCAGDCDLVHYLACRLPGFWLENIMLNPSLGYRLLWTALSLL